MRMYMPLALALALPAAAQTPTPFPPQASTLQAFPDPVLEALLGETLARSPDLAQASDLVAAERERIPQARALPDPTLSLGIVNDGFKQLQVGKMDSSYYQVMLTQPFFWPGKRGLKADVARLGAEASGAELSRQRLTLRAEVKRAYFALLLVRDQLRLLEQQAPLLEQAEGIARTRYEVGQGSQTDLLRAQLARTRLAQSRLTLNSEERTIDCGPSPRQRRFPRS